MKKFLFLSMPLVGCGGGLSDEEIGQVFAATTLVSSDIQTEVVSQAGQQGPAKELTWEGDSSGWTFSGTISGSALWTGTVAVDGSGSYSPTENSFDLGLEYQDVVYTASNYTMNGTVDQAWDYTIDGANYSFNYDLVGNIDVSGDASGSADIDISVTYENGAYTYEGSINGMDVAEMQGTTGA